MILSKELREALIQALQTPEMYKRQIVEVHLTHLSNLEATEKITFTKEDLMLGSVYHNRPLYVTGCIDRKFVKRILVDPGAAVNLMPLYTLLKIGYTERDLKHENVVVCGFNQNSQHVAGSISLILELDDFKTIVKFHVIDADTSYGAMLGRPWLHQNWVVPSTLHQCLKYIQDGVEKRIIGDLKPFSYKEAHYSDAKFFLKDMEPPKIYLKKIEFPKRMPISKKKSPQMINHKSK